MGFPTAEEFITPGVWYFADGKCVGCPDTPEALRTHFEGFKRQFFDAPDIDGAKQLRLPGIYEMSDTAIADQCLGTVNAIARGDAAMSQRIGQEGLLKIWYACVAEGQDQAPIGFTREVTSLYQNGGGDLPAQANGEYQVPVGDTMIDRRVLWVAGAVLAAYLLS